jgi:uncharacterized membrane protein (UPF0127 family)
MIVRIDKGELSIAKKVRVADTFLGRAIGLMFSDSLGEYDGLLIQPTNAIHTFFMKYNLDIIFLNRNNEVVSVVREMKPWRHTKLYFRAIKVIEMKGGTFPESVKVGDKLNIECIN